MNWGTSPATLPARCALRRQKPKARTARLPRRRGVSTIWLILCLPAVLCLLGVVVESGNLWLARVELTNALEAAALAGADQWGDAGPNTPASRLMARDTAVEFAAANTVNSQAVGVSANGGGGGANGNAATSGNVVILGAYRPATREFDASQNPNMAGYDRAVQVRASVPVDSIIGTLCGASLAPFEVTTQATARYDGNQPKLVRVTVFSP